MPRIERPPAKGEVLQSATRTLSALDALSHYADGATAKTLSADLGLHLSTTYHLLNTLVAVGYAVQDPISRHFRLGPRIPYLHQAFVASLQPPAGILTLLHVLQETTGETVHLGRLHGQDVVVIASVAGTHPDAVPEGYIGLSAPAHAIAIGQAILASMPSPLLAQFLREADLSRGGLFPATDASRVRRDLAQVRVQGYAVDRGDRSRNVFGCLASPVTRVNHDIPDALSVMAPRSRFLREEQTVRAAVTAVAHAASALGPAVSAEPMAMTSEAAAQLAMEQELAALRPQRLSEDRR